MMSGIREIAKKSGVSISTVSRILNGTKPVSPELRARVERVIREEDYVPNHAARSMVMRKTRTAGLIIPKMSFLYHQEILRYIENVMERNDYRLIVASVDDETEDEVSYVRLMREKKVDGIILMHESRHPEMIELLRRQEIPVVLASVHIPHTEFPSVGIDEYTATFDGTEYLIGLGHTRIGYIGGPGPFLSGQRFQGFISALQRCGINSSDDSVADGRFTMHGGREAALDLLDRRTDLTALFVTSDEMAIGVMRAAHEMNMRVPEDLSVLGFDGIRLGNFVVPSLSTVYQPIEQIGTTAANLLLQRMHGAIGSTEALVVPHRVVSRESCSPRT